MPVAPVKSSMQQTDGAAPVAPVIELQFATLEDMRAAHPTPPRPTEWEDSSASSITSASVEDFNSDDGDSANHPAVEVAA